MSMVKSLIIIMLIASSSGSLFKHERNGVVIYKLEKEVLEMNTKKGTERFHLPSVEGSNQVDIIHDFGKKLSMYYFPDIKGCYLLPLNSATQLSPQNLVIYLRKALRLKKTRTKTKAKWTVLRQIKSRKNLTNKMATLCAKVPIYRVKVSTDSDSKGRFRRNCIKVVTHERYSCNCRCTCRWGGCVFSCRKRCGTCCRINWVVIC